MTAAPLDLTVTAIRSPAPGPFTRHLADPSTCAHDWEPHPWEPGEAWCSPCGSRARVGQAYVARRQMLHAELGTVEEREAAWEALDAAYRAATGKP